MFRHYFITALRSLAANRLQSVIALGGLSIGIATAILIALVVLSELTFDHFIPGHDRLYAAISILGNPAHQHPDHYMDTADVRAAALLKLNIPGIEGTARLMDREAHIRVGAATTKENIYWADPNAFDVLPLPVYRGSLATALRRPDGLVMARSMARKYFGSDDAIGRTVLLNGHPAVLRAIVEDFPANATNLKNGIFASGAASYSDLAVLNAKPPPSYWAYVNVFVRLKPGVAIAPVQAQSAALIKPLVPPTTSLPWSMRLVPLDQLPLVEGDGLHPGAHERIAVSILIGFLVLFIAMANFVNLTVARAARREREVGMRKVTGAARRDLMLQFLGEAVLIISAATIVAMALCEWMIPAANAFLQSGADFAYWRNPAILPGLLACILALGLVAGAYPAFLLSAFRPAAVLRGWRSRTSRGGLVRSGLVTLQFAILLCLLIAAAVVFQQRAYAMNERLRVNTDQILLIHASCPDKTAPDKPGDPPPCWASICTRPAFRSELRKLPGVRDALCSHARLMDGDSFATDVRYHGRLEHADLMSTEYGIFSLYGVKILAGALPPDAGGNLGEVSPVVINASAVKRFGFATPQAAIGQTLPLDRFLKDGITNVSIAAVVSDFSLRPVSEVTQPTIYLQGPVFQDLLHVQLRGKDIPETLQAIDLLWSKMGDGDPIDRTFLSSQMQKLYLGMLREAQLFGIFAGVAVMLACLGLFGLSVDAAERRIKEIGIRKAMGARNGDVLLLLLWQFARPVLIANLIGWPLAWWAMTYWLSGFEYRVPLHWWLFPAAGTATLLIALLTVSGQAWLVARQKPVSALRYE